MCFPSVANPAPLDFSQLRDISGGSVQTAERVVKEFVDWIRVRLLELWHAIEAHDVSHILLSSSQILESAQLVGAVCIAHSVEELREACFKDSLGELEPTFKKLETQLDIFQAILSVRLRSRCLEESKIIDIHNPVREVDGGVEFYKEVVDDFLRNGQRQVLWVYAHQAYALLQVENMNTSLRARRMESVRLLAQTLQVDAQLVGAQRLADAASMMAVLLEKECPGKCIDDAIQMIQSELESLGNAVESIH